MSILKLALQGRHNVYTSMAGGIAARVLEVTNPIIRESFSDFQHVEHRMEQLGEKNKVEFINDSLATNVNSTWWALESMDKTVVWIAGGVDIGNDYGPLTKLVATKVRAVFDLSVRSGNLAHWFATRTRPVLAASSMEEAVLAAAVMAEPGDVVLLSPACASFDRYANYEERGRRFKEAVARL